MCRLWAAPCREFPRAGGWRAVCDLLLKERPASAPLFALRAPSHGLAARAGPGRRLPHVLCGALQTPASLRIL